MFQSRPLNNLIEGALVANPDIRAASAGLRVAQFNARAQRATLFPTVQAGFGASQNQTSDVLAPIPANGNTIYGLFTAGLTISYTLDLFGANRRAVELLEALAEAQCFQLEAAYLSLASNVVAAAIQEASLRAQIEATGASSPPSARRSSSCGSRRAWAPSPAPTSPRRRPRSPRPRPPCHRSKRRWRSNATCWPR